MVSSSRSHSRAINMQSVTLRDVFAAAGLEPIGPVPWGTDVSEGLPGVYVVALVETVDMSCPQLMHARVCKDPRMEDRWQVGQSIIYIGRTRRSLRKRIKEFYKHDYGDPKPHSGGQEVLCLECDLWIYWASTDDPEGAEHMMIEHYRAATGAFPYANKVKAAKTQAGVGQKSKKAAL